ncbi:MAG: DNA polymerase III subunit alpha [Rhodospirillaceae bacterium]|nr:DNA polymerase III subunit alpha [Rhodospirillaceae bacterium]
MTVSFVHLRSHSAYSLSEGAIKIKDLIGLAKKNSMPAVALTDTNNLFGAMEFSLEAKEDGIQPILGCQLSIVAEKSSEAKLINSTINLTPHLILLIQNEIGYKNLSHLVSKAYINAQQLQGPAVFLEELVGKTEGMIALTGGPSGLIGYLLQSNNQNKAEEVLLQLKQLFPNRLYIELMRHGMSEESQTEDAFIAFAQQYHIPLVATNEAFFGTSQLYEAHDVLLCIAEGATISEPKRRRVTPDHYFKSTRQMMDLFSDIPEALDNTVAIAKRCGYLLEPRKTVFPKFVSNSEKATDEVVLLKNNARDGLKIRMEQLHHSTEYQKKFLPEIYSKRLEYELDLIVKMGFAGYFLIVADFIQWAKKQQIPVGPGRGSGAGSVVAWALTITDLDPIRWGLLFERFLNPERVSLPDFDIDFCQDRRDEVINYVRSKYGFARVAQIITFGKLQARAVLRDVGRVLQLPYGQIDKLCKQIPNNPANPVTLKQVLEIDKQLQEIRKQETAVDKLFTIALQLEGLYRHASTHAAGVVIGDQPLEEVVPLYRDAKSNMPATQFNMKYVEMAGLIKFDFLGLKTLTMIALAEALILKRGIKVDVSQISLSDHKTYEILGKGDATGVFQLESGGMRDVLRKLKPDRFEDIIAVVALYRPGPMDNIPKYIACKHQRESPDYLHPMLEEILRETFGIMIYQEQVMQIAQILAGYSLGKADILRRAMGKKIKEEMEAQRKDFIDGAKVNQVDAATATRIFEEVNKFAGYGFNKSHAAAYALIAYQTAWLKANYPVEFFAASMSLEMNNTDKLNLFRQELVKNKIPLLPPDINYSHVTFTVEKTTHKFAVRYALPAIRHVGANLSEMIVQVREVGGIFKSIQDFIARVDSKSLNKRQLESLICAGAFDSLFSNRHQGFQSIDIILQQAAVASKDRQTGQFGLFGSIPSLSQNELIIPHSEDWNSIEKLQREHEAIGFYLSAHPLDNYERQLKHLHATPYIDLLNGSKYEGRVMLAGVVVSKVEKMSSKGNRYAYVRFSDRSGIFEIMFFSDILNGFRDFLEPGNILLIGVDVRDEQSEIKLTAQTLKPLAEAVGDIENSIKIHLRETQVVASLSQIFAKGKSGKDIIRLIVEIDGKTQIEVNLGKKYHWSTELQQQVIKLLGQDCIEETT